MNPDTDGFVMGPSALLWNPAYQLSCSHAGVLDCGVDERTNPKPELTCCSSGNIGRYGISVARALSTDYSCCCALMVDHLLPMTNPGLVS